MLDFVILLTGQSNSQGTGGSVDIFNVYDHIDNRIFSWNIYTLNWEIANLTNTIGTKPPFNQCFAFHFAKHYLLENPFHKVGIVNIGYGSMPICRWTLNESCKLPSINIFKPDLGDIYAQSIYHTKLALMQVKRQTPDVILYHQGEADYEETHEYYKERLYNLIKQYRQDLNYPELKFIAGELLNTSIMAKQNCVLNELNYDKDMYTRCAFTKNLFPAFGDFLHFCSDAHRLMGKLYYDQYKMIYYSEMTTLPEKSMIKNIFNNIKNFINSQIY